MDYIDSRLSACNPSFKFWGLTEITTKSKDRFPVTIPNREKVCIDDRYDCVVWHREVSGTQEDNEDLSFGLYTEKQFNVTLRTVVAYKVELGEEFKFTFINEFPYNIYVDGYSILEVVSGSVNLNHEAVATEEEIHTHYEKHRLCWNIFSFDNEIQFILCPDSSPSCRH